VNGDPTYLVNKLCARLTGNAVVTYAASMSKSTKPPVQIYSALADATRCKILTILQTGPIPVHKLADAFSISRPAISRHLRVLKTAGLVAEVKKGRENLYAFKPAKLERARAWIELMAAPREAAVADAAPEVIVEKPKLKSAKKAAPKTAKMTAPKAAEPPAASVEDNAVLPAPTPSISQMGFDF
jgi:DNA-binding transcriptional ArsR family regulator